MKKAVLLLAIIVPILLMTITKTTRNILVMSTNRVMDSQESLIINEIDSRLMSDFSIISPPKELEFTKDSLQYNQSNKFVRVSNNSENKIDIYLKYEDGTEWSNSIPGQLEVSEVEVVNINNQTKVNLKETTNRVIAVTFKFTPTDSNAIRGTINRDYTRYLLMSK